MRRRTLLFPLLVFACALVPSMLSGQVRPLTGVFQVSPQSYGFDLPGRYQTYKPSLTAVADGSFVVAWAEDLEVVPEEGNTEVFYDIYARKVRAEGSPGRLVRVDRGSTEQDVYPGSPELAADGQGGFTLVWERLRFDGVDALFQHAGPGRFVRPDAGVLLRPEREGQGTRLPSVAANAPGDFVIAWEEWLDPQGLRRRIGVRPFQASGEPAGPEILIESPNPQRSLYGPRVAVQQDGSFLVAWGVSGPHAPLLQGQTFDADGTPRGPIFQIAAVATIWEVVAGDPERGEFLVAWSSSTQQPVRIRRYSPDGARLATSVLGRSRVIWRLSANHQGDLVFLWSEPDGDVRARLLNENAVFQGPPFQIARIVDQVWIGDITLSDTGRIFAAWVDPVEVTTPGGAKHRPVVGRIWRAEE